MDEYTFVVLAKLKADRLKLEREQGLAPQRHEPAETEPAHTHRRSARTQWFSQSTEWREQS